MRRGGEDGALVVFQHLEPGGDIRRVIFTHFRREFEVGAEESASQLRYEFLAGIALVAPGFATEVAVEPGRVLRPVRRFMRQCGIEGFSVAKSLDDRHLDVVAVSAVIGAVAPVADVGLGGREERLGM
jgi:hypothetical protein